MGTDKSKIDKLFFSILAASRRHIRIVSEAVDFLSGTLDETAFVSFSAGKDSMVCAHLCNKVMPGIPILMVDPGCPTHWTEIERSRITAYAKMQGWNMHLFEWDKWGEKRDDAHLTELHKDMFSDLTAYADENGLTTRVMGLRCAESRARSTTARYLGQAYTYADGKHRRLLPISEWTTNDVWAYTVRNEMPWLDIYDVAGPDARNGLIGVNGHERGRLEYLKHYFPEAWEKAKRLIEDGKMTGL